MERTDVKNNHTEEYSTGQIRCIEKSDPEYPQIMKQYSSMPAKLYVKGRLPDPKRRTVAVPECAVLMEGCRHSGMRKR